MDVEILENIREVLGERAANYFQNKDSQIDYLMSEVVDAKQELKDLQAVVSILRRDVERDTNFNSTRADIDVLATRTDELTSKVSKLSADLQKLTDEL